ncbi:hypothetical protein [uncultured Methylibium sp.]|uniref:hypothetical protein n=1 Tax=uncultured Methylibium sp. TaxID=381093 RepID=UPI0025FD62EA|nr:hypothetical protein [uncultured Methylibium sp.]
MWTTWSRSPAHEAPFLSLLKAARLVLVASLLRASSALLHVAVRLQHRAVPAALPTVDEPDRLEFHAEAGAPEGALYVDGQLAGWLSGVTRL